MGSLHQRLGKFIQRHLVNKGKDKMIEKSKFPDASILLHPNIPKPLHGLAPRTIIGQEWWDEERYEAYARYGFCCHACGVHKDEFAHRKGILDAHEMYQMDYKNGKMIYLYSVALCHYCHNFIHNGRMAIRLKKGEISWNYFVDVLYDGFVTLKKAELPPNVFALMSYLSAESFAIEKRWKLPFWAGAARKSLEDNKNLFKQFSESADIEWSDWRLVLNGKEYEPIHKTFEDWVQYYNS